MQTEPYKRNNKQYFQSFKEIVEHANLIYAGLYDHTLKYRATPFLSANFFSVDRVNIPHPLKIAITS